MDLGAVERTPVRGTFFRHVPKDGKPLFQPKHPADGRWQRGSVVEGFYLAANEPTAWAEWYRSLAELAVPPMRQMPRDLWRFDVRLDGVADLSSDERLKAAGLPPPEPTRSQWAKYQAVGEALAEAGWPGILFPSAARAGASSLCLFRHAPRITGVEPVGPPKRLDEPPAPPRGLRT